MDTWNPTTEQEIKLKDALLKLHASTDGVILTPENQKREEANEMRFILQAEAYFALKAYVMTGKAFPTTGDQFVEKIPKDCFKKLHEVDAKIYNETKSGLVKMGQTCKEFYDNHLYRMVNAGSLAVTWSEKTLDLLKETEEFNLYDQLMVLLDIKYQKPSDRDQAWIDAYNGAMFSLDQLIEEANAGKNEAEGIRDVLLKFRDTTEAEVLPLVKVLVQKYSTGPVDNPKVENKPYLNFLNEDLAKITKDMEKTLTDYNKKYDQWKSATGLAIGIGVSFGWVPVLGWVPLAFTAHNANMLQRAWAKLEKSYNQLVQHSQNEAALLECIQSMVKQFDGLLEKMEKAIKAVGTLSTMFSEQSQAYVLIRDLLRSIKKNSTEADARIRKTFIESRLKQTVKRIRDLQAAGAGFMKAILIEDQDILKNLNPVA